MKFNLINIDYLRVLFVLIFLINIVDGNRWRCDYTFVRRAKGFFKFHEIPASWSNAQLRCELEGAELASPYPQEIKEVLLELMKDNHQNRSIFTGIHATFSNGDYYTVNGIPLSKIPIRWMESEPDNKNEAENCLIMNPQGLAADTNCNDTHPYFCYRQKKDDDLFMDQCGTTDRAYEYSAVTHSCYKFHTIRRTWSRAFMACAAEGGHLAIINSDAEAEVIRNLFIKHPANLIIGNVWKEGALIGYYNKNEGGGWRTIHGETVENAGYAKFHNGKPDNPALRGEFYGSIHRNGLLNDNWNFETYLSICEKKPNSLICDDEDY